MPHPKTFLSLSQAAKETGKSKSVIYKALQSGRLRYAAKEGNAYKIDPAELFRVFEANTENPVLERPKERLRTPENPQESGGENASNVSALSAKVELLEERLKDKDERLREKDERIAELKEERNHWKVEKDRWHQSAERLQLTYQPIEKPSEKPTEARNTDGEGLTTLETEPTTQRTAMSGLRLLALAVVAAIVVSLVLQSFDAEIKTGLDILMGAEQENESVNLPNPAENGAKNGRTGRGEPTLEPLQSHSNPLPEMGHHRPLRR